MINRYLDIARGTLPPGIAAEAAAPSCGEKADDISDISDQRGIHGLTTLPPVHEASDPQEPIPTTPCRACSGRRWRLWRDDANERWHWWCCHCHPLVVINPDGSVWRDGVTIRSAGRRRGDA